MFKRQEDNKKGKFTDNYHFLKYSYTAIGDEEIVTVLQR